MVNNSVDWIGMKYGRLEVIGITKALPPYRGWRWVCRCDCGNVKVIDPHFLKHGDIVSCGMCARRHIDCDSNTRLYKVWSSMRQRCNNPNTREYHRYGGRGIQVCEEWNEYANFKEWAFANGYDENAPHGECTLDRIDNDGNYEPTNCRWVSLREQMKNRPRRSAYVEYKGEQRTLYEWASIVGIDFNVLRLRMRYGWSIERILTTPARKKSKTIKKSIFCGKTT